MTTEHPKKTQTPAKNPQKAAGKKEEPNPKHRQDFERLLDDAIGISTGSRPK